jgi:hypothetical protein
VTSQHECVDCAALPVDDRPNRPRPATKGGPRSRRCYRHWKAKQDADRKARHDSRVVKTYGLQPGEYEELLAFQGGTCAIPSCKANGKARRLAVDHDHVTGEPRGILCGPHNRDLVGKFANDLQAGLDYLANPPAARFRRARLEEAS